MNIYALIPLVSFIAYIPLLVLVLRQPRSRVFRAFRAFAVLLFSGMLWSFGSFMLHSSYSLGHTFF